MHATPRLPPILRDAPIAVASLDLEGRILDANRALAEAAGYAVEDLRGRGFAEFLDQGAEPDARASFAALASGATDCYRAERRYRTRGGDVRHVDLSVSLVRDAEGRPASCLAVLQDVTGHRRALREAASRAAELEAVIQSIPAAVFIGDRAGLTLANQVALDQLGVASQDDLRDLPALAARLQVRDLATGVPIPVERLAFSRALAGERVDSESIVTHQQTGEDRILRTIAAPILLDGEAVGAVAINVDITDERATEEALRLSEARYRALVDQSPLSIQILAPDGTTLHVNRAWERLWGTSRAQLGDHNIFEDRQLVDRGLMPYIRKAFAGEPVQVPAAPYDPHLGLTDASAGPAARRWVRAVVYPLKAAAGRVREVVVIHEDMTEQARAEEERRQVTEERERLLVDAQRAHVEAETASRVKDEFLAVLSHELRTPLNAVLGWARILRTRPIGDQTAHAVTVIERNANAQARLIDDLLDLSRIITGKIRLSMERVDVAGVATAALDSVRPGAEAKRIAIDLRIEEGLPAVMADAGRLQQIFWNLLANAVKFTEPGGSVAVSVFSDAHNVHGEISDTGIGIAPEILPSVFDRFTQGDSSSTRAHSGLGLGLAIVRHLAELHGGTVVASSDGRGCGATFRLSIPRPLEQAEDAPDDRG